MEVLIEQQENIRTLRIRGDMTIYEAEVLKTQLNCIKKLLEIEEPKVLQKQTIRHFYTTAKEGY